MQWNASKQARSAPPPLLLYLRRCAHRWAAAGQDRCASPSTTAAQRCRCGGWLQAGWEQRAECWQDAGAQGRGASRCSSIRIAAVSASFKAQKKFCLTSLHCKLRPPLAQPYSRAEADAAFARTVAHHSASGWGGAAPPRHHGLLPRRGLHYQRLRLWHNGACRRRPLRPPCTIQRLRWRLLLRRHQLRTCGRGNPCYQLLVGLQLAGCPQPLFCSHRSDSHRSDRPRSDPQNQR